MPNSTLARRNPDPAHHLDHAPALSRSAQPATALKQGARQGLFRAKLNHPCSHRCDASHLRHAMLIPLRPQERITAFSRLYSPPRMHRLA